MKNQSSGKLPFVKWLCSFSRIGRLEFLNQTEGQTFSISLKNTNWEFDIPNGEVFFCPCTKTTWGESLDVLALWVSLKSGDEDKISRFPLPPSCVAQFEDGTDLYWKLSKDPRKGLPEIEETMPYLTLIASYFGTSTKVDQFLKLPSNYKIQKERIYTLLDFDFLFSQSDESQPNKLSEEIPIEQPEIDASPQVDSEPEDQEADEDLRGWVSLYRKLLNNPIFLDPKTLQLFIYGLLKANHKPHRIIFDNQEMVIERGQFITGIHKLSKETGQSSKSIRNRLAILENTAVWARKRASKFSIITICNYNHYQNPEKEKGQGKGQGKEQNSDVPILTYQRASKGQQYNKDNKKRKDLTFSGKGL